MKYNLLVILFIFSFLGCKDNIGDKSKRNENWVWWVDAKTGKAGWIPVNVGDPVKDGKYIRFYFNGNRFSSGRLVDGNDVDTIFHYDLNGRLQSYDIIKSDTVEYFIHDGPAKTFYANGHIAASGIIKNHTFWDKWYQYFENGKPEFVKNLTNGIGWATSYYSNGQVEDSDYYYNKESFNIKQWYKSGQLEQFIEFKKGTFNGIGKVYYESGQLKATGYYVDGKQSGEQKFWYEDGRLRAIGNRKNGLLDGRQIIYYETGKIQAIVYAKMGERDGELTRYDENGKLVLDQIFKDGVLVENKLKDVLWNKLKTY